jgi:hypothetical protein
VGLSWRSSDSRRGEAMPDTEEDAFGGCAIRVRQRIQFEADRLLQSKGVESYFPFIIEVRRWSDRSRKVRVPYASEAPAWTGWKEPSCQLSPASLPKCISVLEEIYGQCSPAALQGAIA